MNQFKRLEQFLDDLFVSKAPALAANVKEAAAKVLPWAVIVLSGFGLVAWFSSVGLLLTYFGWTGGYAVPYASVSLMYVAFYLLLAPVIQGLGLYGGYLMLSRQRKGWTIVYYSLLIGLIPQMTSFSIVGLLLNVAFLYLMFQIKSQYAVGMAE